MLGIAGGAGGAGSGFKGMRPEDAKLGTRFLGLLQQTGDIVERRG